MKKFLHVLISVAIGLVPLAIAIIIVVINGIDLGAVNDHPEYSGFPAGLLLIFGAIGWGVCTSLVYALKDFDTNDVSCMNHPTIFRVFWSFMATLAIGGGFAYHLVHTNTNAFISNDGGFLTYLSVAWPLGVAGFIFTTYLARAFFFDSLFKKFLLPLAVMGGLFIIAIPLYFIGRATGNEARGVLWIIVPCIGILTLPVMGIIGLKEFFSAGSSSSSSGSSSNGGGNSSSKNPRDALSGMYASYTLGCTVTISISSVTTSGSAVYLVLRKNVTHAWHENENEEKAQRLATQKLVSEATRRLKRIDSKYYIAGVN